MAVIHCDVFYVDINEIIIYEGLKIFCTLTKYSTKFTLQAIFVSKEP